MNSRGMVVIGPIFVDVKGYPKGTYIPGGRNAGSVEYVHGGVSRNVAEDMAHIGMPVTFLSQIDPSALGRDVATHLEAEGVNNDYLLTVPDGMGTWLAVFDNTGDVVAAISKRPDMGGVRKLLQEEGDRIISACDGIAMEIDMDEDIVLRILELAKQYDKNVYALISNMTVASERIHLFPETACVVCNLSEMGILFNEDYEALSVAALQEKLLEKIREQGMKRMVVTMGDRGAVYAETTGETGFVSAINVQVVDTTGAGDAFFAGVSAALTRQHSLEDACRLGTKMAASVIQSVRNVCPVMDMI